VKLSSVTTRLRQRNALDAVYNRWANRTDRPRRLLRHPYPDLARGSSRRLNRMIERLPAAARYLEIGVYVGATFETIRGVERVGVDPDPLFDVGRLPGGTHVFIGTSDDFFRSLPSEARFDVVFVDGLHQFDQAYRDVVNSFNHLAPGGVLLVDDVVPFDEISAMHDWTAARERRRAVGDSSNFWNGDVFVTLMVLVEHHPSIRVRTIIGSGNPQAVMWQSDDDIVRPIDDRALATYSSVTYGDVFMNGVPDWFATGTEDEILDEAITACAAQRRAPPSA
jgi:SAM-dependent methyltransferase